MRITTLLHEDDYSPADQVEPIGRAAPSTGTTARDSGPQFCAMRLQHDVANAGQRMDRQRAIISTLQRKGKTGNSPASAIEHGVIQRAFIIGEPVDGSYYNQFSVADAVRTLGNLHLPGNLLAELMTSDMTAPLERLHRDRNKNYASWGALVKGLALQPHERKNIDDVAFLRALGAAEHLLPHDIKVSWGYAGNLAEAATRIVREKGRFRIELDVNPKDDWPEYFQLYHNHDQRLGQRITMFTHELAYHAIRDAIARFAHDGGDPDEDHRRIFLPATREKYFIAFLNAFMQNLNGKKRASDEEKRALIQSWYDDVEFHIDDFGADDNEKEEARAWLLEQREEVEENLQQFLSG